MRRSPSSLALCARAARRRRGAARRDAARPARWRRGRARSPASCAASVCQSESIDESNADIARDLRLLVRERIVAGDSDAEVLAFVVDRYGEFVLFRPPFTCGNAPLWLAGPACLLFGGGLAFAFIRRRARAGPPPRPPLTPEEEARLDALTGG